MVVVTGGLGFIGNELVRQLIAKNLKVTVVDNKNRIAPKIEDLSAVPIVQIDISDYTGFSTWLKDSQVKTIYHLAAIHYIPECNENPERTLRINVEGTQSILRAASEAGVGKIIFASSGAVYADSNVLLRETSPVGPVDVYGWSKLFGEQLCTMNHELYGTPMVIARLFNNYGPRETNPHIIPEIINQLRKGDLLQLGKITTVRDYIHTSDCAKALIQLALHLNKGIETVNVATGKGYTVQQLIDLISDITKRSIEVKHDSGRMRRFDKHTQVADITHLKKLTGWEPEIDIRQGVKELLRFEKLI